MKNSHNSAFSLIELSIVILIIGILIAGVIQGSKIYAFSKLQVARSLTTSSPVVGIKDLMLWYETSLETSFKSTEAIDSTAISTWYDNNPQAIAKNNATNSTTSQKPIFYENVLNGVPAIRFDGSDDKLPFDGSFFVGTSYTVFVVEQRRAVFSTSNRGPFIQNNNGSMYNAQLLGYYTDNLVGIVHYPGTNVAGIAGYSNPIPRIHTFWFSTTSGLKYWLNGGVAADASNSSATSVLNSNAGNALGGGAVVNHYGGDLFEVICFSRDLTTEERQSVEDYLSKKYAVKIQ
jgi:prepilin-type N-terminal cleavage/methylation domain-containing protein